MGRKAVIMLILVAGILGFPPLSIAGQSESPVLFTDPGNLEQGWKWADSAGGGEFWIGYSIRTPLRNHLYYAASRRNQSRFSGVHFHRSGPPLKDLLDQGIVSEGSQVFDDFRDHVTRVLKKDEYREARDQQMVVRELALLFLVTRENETGRICVPRLHSLSLPFACGPEKLFWLGEADPDRSLSFLMDRFVRCESLKEQQGLVRMVGIHPPRKAAGHFLAEVLSSRRNPELRKTAALYLGRHPGDKPVSLLTATAREDSSSAVRRYAVFGLSEIRSELAVDALIGLARAALDFRVRKTAISALGDIASRRVVTTLADLVDGDEFTEIQNRAVYALEDLPGNEGIPILIRVAQTHPKYQIRKSAIHCLGESGDPRALQALIDIIRQRE